MDCQRDVLVEDWVGRDTLTYFTALRRFACSHRRPLNRHRKGKGERSPATNDHPSVSFFLSLHQLLTSQESFFFSRRKRARAALASHGDAYRMINFNQTSIRLAIPLSDPSLSTSRGVPSFTSIQHAYPAPRPNLFVLLPTPAGLVAAARRPTSRAENRPSVLSARSDRAH